MTEKEQMEEETIDTAQEENASPKQEDGAGDDTAADKEKKVSDQEETNPADGQDAAPGQETQENNEEESGEGEESKKKGFFGKDKKEKKDKKDQRIEELSDQYKRTLAEFDNFRKRTEREKAAMFEVGARNIIEKILPVVDNFERGLATVPEEEKGKPFCEGMDKIYKQLVKQLEEAGVKEIEAMDKEFDPNFHNAVMHVEDENAGENVIVEVFQKGYTYRDTVVRHSMVKVAN